MAFYSDEKSPIQSSKRSLEEGLALARTQLGDKADSVLPSGKIVTGLFRESFQSRTFRSAGYGFMPERYPNSDRSLIAVTFADGSQTFVVFGRISSGNPYEVGHAAGGGLDLLQTTTLIYEFDGAETIVEKTQQGANAYTGEYGHPEALLPHLRSSLGMQVGREDFELLPPAED